MNTQEQTGYVFRADFKVGSNGARAEVWVYRIERGELIEVDPTRSERTGVGNQGWDEWHFEPGIYYIVVSISRSHRLVPYTVLVQSLYVTTDNRAIWRRILVEEMEDLDNVKDLIEKAKKVVLHG